MEPMAVQTPARAWSTVVILFLLSSTAWMDRSVIAMVIGPIRAHFAIGDFQVSLLIGFAFVFFYITLMVPIGWLADRYSRRRILFAGVLIWSGATMLCGVAASYAQLFAARIFVGAGESCISPVGSAMIGRIFGRERLAGPMSVYSIGTSAGTAAGAIAAGYILGWRRDLGPIVLPVVGTLEPWQLVFVLLGLPGALIAFLALAVIDPPPPPPQRAGVGGSIRAYLKRHGRSYVCTVIGFVAINIGVTGVMTWTPEHLRRRFGATPEQTGWAIATISLVAPLICQLGVGFLVNRLIARGMVDAPLRVMRWLLAAAVPLAIALPFAPGFYSYLACIFALMVVLFPSNPLGFATVQMIAPATLKSQLAAIHVVVLGLVGVGLGSSSVGFLSQYWLGENRLDVAMGLAALASIAVAWTVLGVGRRPTRDTIGALRAAEL